MKQRVNLLSFFLKFLVSSILLALLLIFKTSFPAIAAVLTEADPVWLAVSLSLHFLGLIISALRWKILIQAQGDDVPLGFLVKSYLVGTFFNNFLPSRIGGDVVRIWDGSRYSRTVLKSSAIVLVERLTGVAVLFVFAAGAALLRLDMARTIPVIWVSLLLGLSGLSLFFIFFTPLTEKILALIPDRGFIVKIKEKIFTFRTIIVFYKQRTAALMQAFFWAFCLQINVILHFFLIGKALHLQIHLVDYFIFIPIVLLIQLIPITINGLGLREGAYIEIFQFYGITAGAAFAFALVDVAFMLLIGIIGGIIYVTRQLPE
jgi:glycosyltransferase 2 family protein